MLVSELKIGNVFILEAGRTEQRTVMVRIEPNPEKAARRTTGMRPRFDYREYKNKAVTGSLDGWESVLLLDIPDNEKPAE